MTELDDVLGALGGSGVPLSPTPDQVGQAAAMVRRRRRLKAGAASTGSALSLGALVFGLVASPLGTPTSREQRLDVAATPSDSASPEPSSTPSGPPSEPSSSPQPPAIFPGPSAIATVTGSLAPAPQASGQPGSEPTSEPDREDRAKPSVTRTPEQLSAVCSRENSGVGGGTDLPAAAPWCVVAGVTDAKPEAYAFRVTVCRGAEDAADLSFPTAREPDFVVTARGSSTPLWQWSRGQSFAAQPHTLRLAGGDCFRWTLEWDGRDEDGTLLAADRELALTVSVDAEELEGKTGQARFFTS